MYEHKEYYILGDKETDGHEHVFAFDGTDTQTYSCVVGLGFLHHHHIIMSFAGEPFAALCSKQGGKPHTHSTIRSIKNPKGNNNG